MVEQHGQVVGIRSLSESNSDGRGLVGDEVLKSSTGDVMVEENREVIGIRSGLIDLNE